MASNTRYRDEYADQAFQLSLLGLTNDEMATFFSISTKTFDNWLNKYVEFREGVKAGREAADARVANALFKRAVGMVTEETKVFMYKGSLVKTKVKKHHIPDLQSQVFWLTNRQKQRWARNPVDMGDDSPPMKVTFEVVDARK